MSRAVKMTEGNIPRQLLAYAVPLILGNLFQLTYNVADSVIVGRFLGKEMLAAVGTAGPVMNIFILGASGMSMGAAVIMSRFYGAGREDLVKKEMATVSVFGLYVSLILAAAGLCGARWLLQLLHVPGEILDRAAAYLRIIFLGMPFTYFYNTLSSGLKSVGDSRTPLCCLILASILNGALDYLFVGALGLGIASAAWATVLSQAASAALCLWYVYAKVPILSVGRREFQADRKLLGQTLRYGGVTALQQACQPIGNLLVQGAVNTMGVDVMAAFGAVTKIDDYALVPERNISNAMTTFVAQNAGADQKERIRRGVRTGMGMELAYGALICLAVLALRRPLICLFVKEGADQVIGEGVSYLGLMAFFYFLPGLTNGIQGYYRGMGMMKMTLAGTALQTGLRVIFVYVLCGHMGIRSFPAACAIGWCAMLLLEGSWYWKINHREEKNESSSL